MPDLILDVIRHGEPVGGSRYRGSGTDDPLSPVGWDQMRDALGTSAPWDGIISSPLSRCRQFAVDLAARHGLPLVVDPDLIEVGMGAWEGRDRVAVAREDPEDFAAFYRDPVGQRPLGAEPLERLAARVGEAYRRYCEQHPGRHLLIVCHAGVMRALVGHLLGADARRWYRLRVDYAGLVRIRHGAFGPSIEWFNRARLDRASRSD
ncbi:histidine phosphatase family protein [Thiocapsa imhoffii]|uniref:Histidine phosphatase family protein n=1 Tax=Thiocapsa imhoffii TaxID=382777 RepID=A0A9X0WIZ1_9GAMM|nr:histidine phosphatase family protein [Thiocapsa imhoffii]MBK1645584.1 histidine phosphatase family protein [Thiocapsa imhoffii]